MLHGENNVHTVHTSCEKKKNSKCMKRTKRIMFVPEHQPLPPPSSNAICSTSKFPSTCTMGEKNGIKVCLSGKKIVELVIGLLYSSFAFWLPLRVKTLSLFTVQSLSVLLKNEMPSSCRPSISRTWACA